MSSTARTHRFTARLALIALLAALVASTGWSTRTADALVDEEVTCQGAGSTPPTDIRSDAQPVVLVHGWTGTPLAQTRTLLEALPSASQRQYFLFDYSSAATRWASDPAIAGCLADYIDAVSSAHADAGGHGIVLVVAHSMGGLAVRFALDPATGTHPGLADKVAGVVTLDTPALGSSWGATVGAFLLSARSDVIAGHLPRPDSAAWRCLADGNPPFAGCDVPPYLAEHIGIHQVAGNVTLRRTLFGLQAYDVPLRGDGIVSWNSQTGYNGSSTPGKGQAAGFTNVDCVVDGADLSGGGPLGFWTALAADDAALTAFTDGNQPNALAGLEHYVKALVQASCGHLSITTSPEAIAVTDRWLTQYADAIPAGDGGGEEEPATPTTGGPVGNYYLTDMPHVALEIEGRPGRCTGGCVSFRRGAAMIGGVEYDQSWVMNVDGEKGARDLWSTSQWNALRACTSLTAVVGLTNNSPITDMEFRITLDDRPPISLATVRTGDSQEVSVDLTGVYRFTLATRVVGAPLDAHAVWGHVELTCATGPMDDYLDR